MKLIKYLILLTLSFSVNACASEITKSNDIKDNSQTTNSEIKTVKLEQEFSLKYQEKVKVNQEDLTVSFVKINDSRCPSGVQCIWAGEAKISLKLNKGSDSSELEFVLDPMKEVSAKAFQTYTITLTDLEPASPKSNSGTNNNDYLIRLKVTKD